MKKVSLSGSLRENVGKKDAADQRRQGLVPAVIYGGSEQVHFCLVVNDANSLVFTPNVYTIEIEIAGKKYNVILQDKQMHPITDKVTHMDFMEIQEGKAVRINIPVSLSGQSKGVLNGGKLSQSYRSLKVSGMESDLPDAVDVDITPLKIGDKVRVADLNVPGITFLDAESSVVVAVGAARGASDEEEEEETAAAAEGAEAPAEGSEE